MDLRDSFAARFAAALVDAFRAPERIAQRAYDLADAMLAERARRIDAEEQRAIATEQRMDSPVALQDSFGSLPDEPHPIFICDEELDPSSIEPPYDPSWDAELPGDAGCSSSLDLDADSSRPGLARTHAGANEIRRERSYRHG